LEKEQQEEVFARFPGCFPCSGFCVGSSGLCGDGVRTEGARSRGAVVMLARVCSNSFSRMVHQLHEFSWLGEANSGFGCERVRGRLLLAEERECLEQENFFTIFRAAQITCFH